MLHPFFKIQRLLCGEMMVRVDEWYVPFESGKIPEPEPEKVRHPMLTLVVFDIVDSLKTSILIVLLLFTFVFRAVGVEGTSMVPTLNDGDWLAVTAVQLKPVKRGDIVVITQPWDRNVPIIKRVIGVEGDLIHIDFQRGEVYVNKHRLDEKYILEKTHLRYDVEFPVIVPEGCVFVMGDNRNDSLDSRSGKIGFINKNYILGKTIIRFHPISHWKIENKEA